MGRRPQVTVRTRSVLGEDGLPRGTEEVREFHFADDVEAAPGVRLLDKAKAWKAKMIAAKAAKVAAVAEQGVVAETAAGVDIHESTETDGGRIGEKRPRDTRADRGHGKGEEGQDRSGVDTAVGSDSLMQSS